MAKRFYGLKSKGDNGKYLSFTHSEWLPIYNYFCFKKNIKDCFGSTFQKLTIRESPANLEIKQRQAIKLAKELAKAVKTWGHMDNVRILGDIAAYGDIYNALDYYRESLDKMKDNIDRLSKFCKESGGFQMD